MNLPLLNIITPVSRPHNLGAIRESIIRSAGSFFIIRWYCIYDAKLNLPAVWFADDWIISKPFGNNVSRWGNQQRNHALQLIADGWVYFLDDDNTLHPDFGKTASRLIELFPSVCGYIFSQQRGNEVFSASPQNVALEKIDVAQALFHKKIITGTFNEKYSADFYFIDEIYRRHSDKINFVPDFFTNYNYLAK